MINELDGMSEKMCLVSDSSECVRRLHPEVKWRRAADFSFQTINSLMNEFNSDRNLASKFCSLSRDGNDCQDSESKIVIEAFKKDFELYDRMNHAEISKINKLKKAIEVVSNEFERASSLSRSGSNSIEPLEALIRLRFELAKRVGKNTPSELILRDKQLKTPEEVFVFLKNSWKDEDATAGDQDTVSNQSFTSLERIVIVLKKLTDDLFNVKIEVSPFKDFGALWSIQFKLFENGEKQRLLGTILFDLNRRNFKDNSPVHYTIQCKTVHKPGLIVLSLGIRDFNRVKVEESRSIFHEYGHALHSLLSETRFQSVSGTRGPVDLAEIPSTLFEMIHESSQVQDELKMSERSRQPNDNIHNIQIAALDQLMHSCEPGKDGWTRDLVHKVEHDFPVKNTKYKKAKDWHSGISHFSTYGGSYFAYIYSKEMARLLWRDHFKLDPFNRLAGSLLRKEFLEKGGVVENIDFIKKK